jgi:hypothetical protein
MLNLTILNKKELSKKQTFLKIKKKQKKSNTKQGTEHNHKSAKYQTAPNSGQTAPS